MRRGSAKLKVHFALCVSTGERPTIVKSWVSDSGMPTDRPAARSAAKQILGRNTRPTDPFESARSQALSAVPSRTSYM